MAWCKFSNIISKAHNYHVIKRVDKKRNYLDLKVKRGRGVSAATGRVSRPDLKVKRGRGSAQLQGGCLVLKGRPGK